MNALPKSDVFVDICTQIDYLSPDGARPCANACDLLPNLKRLMACARWEKIPTLSCIDARRPDEVRGLRNPECVLGSRGQHKVSFSLLQSRVVIESDNSLSVPLDVLEHYQQAILVKRHRDPFTNPKLDRLLTEMPARRFVVFGIPLEASLRLLVLGLLLRNRKVALVADACGFWNQNEADMTIRQLMAKGCEVCGTEAVVQHAIARHSSLAGRRPRGRRSVA